MAPSITLTGSFKDLLGNAVTSGTVTAVLMGYGADIPRVAGTAIFDLTSLSASVNGSGSFSLGPFYGNDVITPGPLTTYYQITMPAPVSSGASGGTVTKNYQFSGSGSFDLSNLVPMGTPQRGDNTLANAAIPQVFSPVSHQFLTGLNALGQLSAAQPAASDLSNGTVGSGSVVLASGVTGSGSAVLASGVVGSGNAVLATSPTISGPVVTTGTAISWAGDTGLSRTALGTLAVGNGSQGDATATLQLNKIGQYFGVITAGIGTAPIYSIVSSTAQTASITSTTLYAVPSSGAGVYRAIYSLVTTTAGSAGTATVAIGWNNGSASTSSTSSTISLSSLGSEISNVVHLESAASQNITYSTTVSGATGNPQYALRIRLEYLG